jgi:hypothetical protein
MEFSPESMHAREIKRRRFDRQGKTIIDSLDHIFCPKKFTGQQARLFDAKFRHGGQIFKYLVKFFDMKMCEI